MAETLTVDTSPDSEVLTPDEQDSLQVGEELQTQQESLLAGKYANAEELEKAYIELQSKLGESKTESTEAPTDEAPEIPEEKVEEVPNTEFLDRLWEEATTDSYKDETLQELNNMSTRDLARMHLQYRSQVQQLQPQQLSDDQAASLKGMAGGDEGYASMMGWAKGALQEEEINMYDAVMERGEPLSCFFAVQALKYRYDDSSGVDGQMLTGKAPSNIGDQFKSSAQLVEAMNDPKYDNDPAYRKEIADKLERSNIQF
tara:strand:+ start:1389 stop:2162 length:774 start_codon:yes stop_codon:yes gene_type:complete